MNIKQAKEYVLTTPIEELFKTNKEYEPDLSIVLVIVDEYTNEYFRIIVYKSSYYGFNIERTHKNDVRITYNKQPTIGYTSNKCVDYVECDDVEELKYHIIDAINKWPEQDIAKDLRKKFMEQPEVFWWDTIQDQDGELELDLCNKMIDHKINELEDIINNSTKIAKRKLNAYKFIKSKYRLWDNS